MRYNYLTILLLSVLFNYSQKEIHIYQYEGSDSLSKKLTLKILFNKNGKVTSEKYSDYMENCTDGYADGKYFYSYNDTVLISRSFLDPIGDCTKCSYYYNSQNQLTKEIRTSYFRSLKKGIDKGYGRKDGCIVYDSDFEKKRSWNEGFTIITIYNSKGLKTEEYTPTDDSTMQKKDIWEYNDDGKIKCKTLRRGNNILSESRYKYYLNGYKIVFSHFNENGQTEDSPVIHEFYLDSFGKELSEIISINSIVINSTKKYYNSANLLTRSICFNEKGEAEITHLYKYIN